MKEDDVRGSRRLFGPARDKSSPEDFDKERSERHSKIGQLAVEVDFLRKKSRQLGL